MLLDFTEELPPLTNEEVRQVFVNTLDLITGFSILFLQCSPAEANQLISRVRRELPDRKIEVLELGEPINNLYRLVEGRADQSSLSILFVRGLEKSLEADIKPGYKGLGDYYNLNTVPTILSHLNQQRENFRDHFTNICFVFVLPKFAIRYFVRRAPDFYDWNSGVFEISNSSNQYMVYTSQNNQNWLERKISQVYSWCLISFRTYQKLVTQGLSLFKLGRYEEAISFFDRAISIKSDYYEAWYNRGICLFRLGRYEEAIRSYDEVVNIKSDHYEAWCNRGVCLFRLGRYEEAIRSYDEVVNIKSDYYEAWYNRGVCLFELGRDEEAVESYNRSISVKADEDKSWYNRGVCLFRLGRYEEAVESYNRTISIRPYFREAWNDRGISLVNLGRYQESLQSYDQAIAIRYIGLKEDLYETWYNRGFVLNILGKYEEAIKSYGRALVINPNLSEVWNHRAISLVNLNRYKEAIKSYQQAIRIEPNKYDYWHSKGLVEFIMGDYQASLKAWGKTFQIIGNSNIKKLYDITTLIQEFIEELIPRFTQPLIQETLLIPLLEIYKQSNVITELGAALVNTLHLIVAPAISDHTANQWLSLWRTSSLGNEPAMELPLRLMNTAIEYKKDPSKRQRLWLNLPSEERLILDKALKLVA
jgi:tetratricopeptide (TPR) repeat protein